MMNELQSQTIAWLRFVLVMMVLLVHVHPDASPNYLGMGHLAEGTMAQAAYTTGVSALFVVCNLSVPLFFFISGFLFFTEAGQWTWGTWRGKMKRRVYTLLLPYLIYNLISAANGYLMQAVDPAFTVAWDNPSALPFIGEFWNSTTACVGMTNIFGLDMQLYYPADVPLWFVRDLMVMVLLSPAIYYVLLRGASLYLPLVAVLYVCGVGATFPGPSTNALLFFSLGAFFRLRGIDVVQFVRRRRGLLLSASLVLLAFSTACYEEKYAQQLHQAFYIAGIFVLILFASALIERKWVCVHPLLVKSSFFVFAVHMVPVGYGSLLSLGGSVRHLLFPTASIAGAVAGYAFAMCFIAGAGVLLYLLLEKLAPRVLKVLSGGR